MQGARRGPWWLPRASRATPQTPLSLPTLRDRADFPSCGVVASLLGAYPTASAPPCLRGNLPRSRPCENTQTGSQRAGLLTLFGLPAYRILRRRERGRVAQKAAADRLDLLVEFVEHRYARGNVELDDVALGHHVEHLDQGAKRVAMGHDQDVLAGAQFGNDSGLPEGKNARQGVLERLGRRQQRRIDVGI